MDAQQLQDPEKVSTIWVKNLNKAVNKMNNTVSLMIRMKPKDAITLDTVPLDKTFRKKTYYPRMDCVGIFNNLANSMKTKKEGQETSFGAKIRID